jgi:hypothetical protein
MRTSSSPDFLKASGLLLVLVLAPWGAPGRDSAVNLTLNDLIQQSQYVVEARPLADFAGKVSISIKDAGGEVPSLERNVYRFKRGAVIKNVLGSDLPDTLVVFEAFTGAAVRAQRAAALSEDAPANTFHAYKSPIKEKLLGKEKSVILFFDEVQDAASVTPQNRFEFSAAQSYEKASNRKLIAKALPASAPSESE